MSDRPPPALGREFISGETYRYLGRQYRLKVYPEEVPIRLHGGWLELGLPGSCLGALGLETYAALVAWYTERARDYLPGRMSKWARRLALDVPKFIVCEPRRRWGSSSKGVIRFNWRIIQAPTSLVDYVVVHELVHLLHEDHSKKFWATVGRVMPDYEARKERLRKLGPDLVW